MRTLRWLTVIVAAIALGGLIGCGSSSTNTIPNTDTMYVAARASHGVWGYYADFNIGSLTNINGSPFATQLAPSAIVINQGHTFAYVANANSNTVAGYTFDLNGSMIPNGTQAVGATPVALAIDSGGKFLFVANQTSGSLSVFAIGSNGSLTTVQAQVPLQNLQCPIPVLLPCPAPVSLAVTPTASFLYVADQLQNLVFTYQINASTGALTPDPALPPVSTGLAPSGLAMDSAGTLLYIANRDSESISGFTIGADNSAIPGNLTSIAGSFGTGLSPVAVAVDPSGQYLYSADRDSNQVTGFKIKLVMGTLTALSNSPYSTGTAPVAIGISPTNKFLYTANSGAASLSAFKIDPTTGNLIPASGAVGTGAQPFGIAFGK